VEEDCGGVPIKNYKNAITNELFLFLSAKLYLLEKNSTYLKWAKLEWEWFESSGMINSNNLVNDGLNNCKNNGGTTWTYNQGVILGGLVTLAQAINNSTLISIAENIAENVIKHLTYPNLVLKEPCEDSSCTEDQSQFKGIFVRYLAILTDFLPAINPNKNLYKDWLQFNYFTLAKEDINSKNLCGVKWGGPPTDDLINTPTQTSALDCANAVYLLLNN